MNDFSNFKLLTGDLLQVVGTPPQNIFFAPYFADGTLDLSGVDPSFPIAVVIYPRRVPVRVAAVGTAGVTPVSFEMWVGYPYTEGVSERITAPRDAILTQTRKIYTGFLKNNALQATTAPEVEFFDFDDGAGITKYSWGKISLSVIVH